MSRLNDNSPEEKYSRQEVGDADRLWEHFEDEEDWPKEEKLKDKYAFGLSQDEETGLPRVTAMGRGLIAKRIVEKAGEAGKRVEKDPDMAQRLFRPTDDRVVPARVYGIIAEILTFVYQLNEQYDAKKIPEEFIESEETGEEEFTEERLDDEYVEVDKIENLE
ncbi:MAG: EscU/YscU/HrcU family type III secretion system export apparatus switch protein [Candidatus Eremiobacteraeota bacterium]|nr:EscU/YscU/HrcU family type III secretion system export apparatus switch protein [Candidatus Eremiobacteraeota bacterium]